MTDYQQQLDDLNQIRSLMERSSRFISLSGLSGISAGIIALVGAALAWFGLHFNERSFSPDEYFLYIKPTLGHPLLFLALDGLGVLILALISAFWFTRRNARHKGLKMWDRTAKRMFLQFSIPLVSGGIFCLILAIHGLGWLCAPATLLFYGLALINASKYSFTELGYLGGAEVILGLAASAFPGYALVFWAFGFGILHIIYGVYGWNKYEK
jgi:hypothetical protein